MKNMKMKAATFEALPKYLELAFTYGTSRAENSYGYNLVTLTGVVGNESKYRECGGGYCMIGSAMGQFIQDQFGDALKELTGQVENFYGFFNRNNKVSVDGACGVDCMEKILKNLLGYEISYEYKRDRKGRPMYKTAIKLTKKNIPADIRLYTDEKILEKPVFNVNRDYKYVSE